MWNVFGITSQRRWNGRSQRDTGQATQESSRPKGLPLFNRYRTFRLAKLWAICCMLHAVGWSQHLNKEDFVNPWDGFLGHAGSILGTSWNVLRAIWVHLGPSWAILGHVGAIFWLSFEELGATWGHRGASSSNIRMEHRKHILY